MIRFRRMPSLLSKVSDYLSHHVLIYLFIAYSIYLLRHFFSAAFFSAPIIQDDFALHFANSIEVADRLLHQGRIWGYSAWYCAGRSAFGVDDIWSALFMLLLRPVIGNAASFNISIVAAFYLPPLSAVVLQKSVGCGKKETAVAVVLTMLAVIGMVPVRSFYFFGCYGFVIGTSLCFLLLGILNGFLESPRVISGMALSFFGALSILIHPLSALIFLFLAMPVLIVEVKKLTPVSGLVIIGSGMISVGVNMLWLLPMQWYAPVEKGTANNMQTTFGYIFDILTGNKTFSLMLMLFLISLFHWYRTGKYTAIAVWGIQALLFSAPAFLGTQLGFRGIEPSRFIIPLQFEMIMVIGQVLFKIDSFLKLPYRLGTLLLILLCIKPIPKYTFGFDDYPVAREILSTLQNDNRTGGRVLIQDSYGHPYFNCHFSALLPVLTNRETTANTYRGLPPVYPQFMEGELFGTTLDQLTQSQLRDHFDLYDISHVVVYTPDARKYFDSCGLVVSLLYRDGFSVYKVEDVDGDRCYECSAKVQAGSTGISVTEAVDSVTVLKYHYVPYLKVIPESLHLDSVYLADDPEPYMKVVNGQVSAFEIQHR